MLSKPLSLLALAFILAFGTGAGPDASDDKASLLGVWVAQSIEDDGKLDSTESVKLMRMRFVFQGDKLLFSVNFDGDRVEQYSYTIDATKSPKHLDITPPKEAKQGGAILGIYTNERDELKACFRYDRTKGGRPTEFSTKADSGLILVVFKRPKAK